MATSEVWKIAGGVVIGLSIFTAVDRLYANWEYRQAMKALSDGLKVARAMPPLPTPLGERESCFQGRIYRRYMAPSGNWASVAVTGPDGAVRTCVPDVAKLYKPPN